MRTYIRMCSYDAVDKYYFTNIKLLLDKRYFHLSDDGLSSSGTMAMLRIKQEAKVADVMWDPENLLGKDRKLDGMRRLVSRNELRCCPQRTRGAKRRPASEKE